MQRVAWVCQQQLSYLVLGQTVADRGVVSSCDPFQILRPQSYHINRVLIGPLHDLDDAESLCNGIL